jgi:hypothetical protein
VTSDDDKSFLHLDILLRELQILPILVCGVNSWLDVDCSYVDVFIYGHGTNAQKRGYWP